MAPRSPSSSDGQTPGRTEQLVAATALWCHAHPASVLAAAGLGAGLMVALHLSQGAALPLGVAAGAIVAMLGAALRFRQPVAALLMVPSLVGAIGMAGQPHLALVALVVGIDQGIRLLSSLSVNDALLGSFRRAGRTVMPAGLATGGALAVLGALNGLPSLIGLGAAVGATTVAQVTVLPALMGMSGANRSRVREEPSSGGTSKLLRWAPTIGWTAVLSLIALWPHVRGTLHALEMVPGHLAAAVGVLLLGIAVFRSLLAGLTAAIAAFGTVAIVSGSLVAATGLRLTPNHAVGFALLFCLAVSAGAHMADRQGQSLLETTGRTVRATASSAVVVGASLLVAGLVQPFGPLRELLVAGLVMHAVLAMAALPSLVAMVESAADSEEKGGLWPRLAVTVGLAGDAPVGPGTLGALVAIPLGFSLQPLGAVVSVSIAVILTALSIPITTRYLERTGTHDPSEVVLDELVGCLLAMVMVPFGLLWGWAAFGLFRLFDITKPGPVRYVERRAPGAWGVIGDDVVAGIMAGAVLLGLRFAGTSLGWWA